MPKLPRGRTRRLEATKKPPCMPKMQAVVTMALATAMRRGELAAMRWRDINVKARTLHIPATKTGQPRTMPLSRTAEEVLFTMHLDHALHLEIGARDKHRRLMLSNEADFIRI